MLVHSLPARRSASPHFTHARNTRLHAALTGDIKDGHAAGPGRILGTTRNEYYACDRTELQNDYKVLSECQNSHQTIDNSTHCCLKTIDSIEL